MKVFKKSVWCLLSIFFTVLFLVFTVGGSVASQYDTYINQFFGTQNYRRIESEEGEVFNEYKSDYLNADGTFNDKAMRNNSLSVALETATEGTVLLENKDNALPLAKDSKVSFFGISSSKYLLSGAGSGHLGVSVTTNLSEACKDKGITVNPSLANAYKILSSKYGNYLTDLGKTLTGSALSDKCYVEYGINEAPWDQLNKTTVGNVTNTFSNYGDAAILIISRNDGEDGDTNYKTPECIDNCYLDLANEEINILNNLMELKKQGTFKKVMLVINSASPMQMKHISQYDLDSILWVGIGGNVSFDQIASVISGSVNPSGHLIDTYVYDNYSAPSTVNQGDFTFKTTSGLPSTTQYSHNDKYVVYQEGIYVGYRYYETRYEDSILNNGNANASVGSIDGNAWDYTKEVAYPFGYGSSYTTFTKSNFKVSKANGGYKVSLNIKNTGTVAGKDVAQIYIQKPYTDYDKENCIEKPSVELVGYAKTKLLEPKESVDLTIFIDNESFKSYDSYGYKTYIVEAGDYYLALGENAHDATNNILAAKGKTTSDGMDVEGNASNTHKVSINKLDTTTYAKSSKTGYAITNQFDDADIKLYEGTKDNYQNFKYLSRNNWKDTYPLKNVELDCVTEKMKSDMQYTHTIEEDQDAKMPVFGRSGELSLMSMWGLEYDDPQWQQLLNQVTWEEAVTLATYGGGTAGCVSVNAPDSLAKDGPGGINQGNPNLPNVMCFPSECLMAATFNNDLIEELGNAFGMEILHVGFTGIYGPGANIHRSAFSGRNWEYYSEDGFISGKMLASEVKGLQNRGVIVFTKHFLLNDQERNRYGVSVWANEQSIREIYLMAFEDGVTEGNMNGIMSSFNRVGAIWSGAHKGLLTEVLRNEWGFVGVVQTDAYVGTHMHMALAESIVAGNDFTMGGSNPTALDAYKNNAVVAKALRETVHRILYTKLHSNTMNGMTVNSRIIPVTPWWKKSLQVGSYVSLGLMCSCVVMFALSFIIPYLVNRKLKLENDPSNKGKQIKYFFDVISKKATAISGAILLVAIVSSISVPIAIHNRNKKPETEHICEHVCPDCGGCKDFDCLDPVCGNKCTCDLPCDHACNICGLCLDYDSTDKKCLEKCGGHFKNTQTFEAEDSHVLKYAGERGALGIAQETGSKEKYIGNFNANLGAAIKYEIVASKAQTVTLFASVCKREAAQLFTNNILVTVNGEIIESKGVVPSVGAGEANWVTFYDVCLGCINLKEGRNVIKFTVANDDVGCGFNFNAIKIKSDDTFTFYEGEHICDDVCPDCGLCMNEHCENEKCKEKCTCNLAKIPFNVKDGKMNVNGAINHEDYVTFNYIDQSVSFNVKALKNSSGVLFMNISKLEKDTPLSDLFTFKINGKEIATSTLYNGEEAYNMIKIANFNLVYGDNNFEIISKTTKSINFKGVELGTNEEVDYKNPYEFLTTSDYVMVEGDAYKSTEHCIAMNENAMGSIITFPINASKDTKADLYFNIASRSTSAKISDILKISVNGIEITTDADLPNVGQDFFTYSDVYLANVDLKEGTNEIMFEVLTNDQSINTNMRAIKFENTDATLSWATTSAGLNRLIVEAEETDLTQIFSSTDNRYYPAISGGNGASNDSYLGGMNDAGIYDPGNAIISFKVNSDANTKAKLYFRIGVSGSARASSYEVKVNDKIYTSKQSWSADGWYDWKDQYYGRIDLVEGENIIKVRILAGEPINLDYFIIESSTNVTFNK